MKKNKNFAVIVAALIMALAIVVPVFAISTPAPIDAPVAEAPAPADTITYTPTVHKHVWEMYGQGSASFQVICEGCGTMVSVPTSDFACEHQFVSKADKISGKCITVCTTCQYNVQRNHSWDWAINAYSHAESCNVCGFERTAEQHTFDTVITVNGHAEACSVCGFERNVEEHDLETEYDSNAHWERCVECGFETECTSHNLVNDFWDNIHEIWCDECGYSAVRHSGVTWEDSGNDCTATCHCGATETMDHDWDGFICTNCDHALSGPTGAVVKSISEIEDGCRVRFEVNGERHYLNLTEVNFGRGDYVVINHNGNVIENIEVMVHYGLCEDPDNPHLYLNPKVYEDMHFADPSNNFVNEIYCHPNNYQFNVGNMAIGISDENAIVYDFENGRLVDLSWICIGERLVWFYIENQIVILDYCW